MSLKKKKKKASFPFPSQGVGRTCRCTCVVGGALCEGFGRPAQGRLMRQAGWWAHGPADGFSGILMVTLELRTKNVKLDNTVGSKLATSKTIL